MTERDAALDHASPSQPALVLAAWLVVTLPAAWGLSFTIKNAMKLFTAPTTVTAPAASQAPVTSQVPATPPASH